MLIDWLRRDPIIRPYIRDQCSENEIEVTIDDQINRDNLIVIKVDDYYNNEVPRNERPKSPDCLIIQRCEDHFDIYIVELRNIKGPDGFSVKEIEEKFITCLDDFMYQRFGNYFCHYDITINVLRLFLVSDPYGFKTNPEKQLYMRGTKFELLQAIILPKFFGKHIYIEPHIPDPTILSCA